MPNRLLFEELLTSGRWNDLPTSAARECYIRLMLVADDFGCYDGRDSVVANQCYPTHRTDVGEMLAQLQVAGLIVRYSNAGKPYIALMRWRNHIRGKRKFPAPPVNNDSPDIERHQGHYGRSPGWANPRGCDTVSILLDAQMRPTVPQPREWRLVDKGWAPDDSGTQGLDTAGAQPLATTVTKPYAPSPEQQALAPSTGTSTGTGKEKAQAQALSPDADIAVQRGEQGLKTTAATAAATNGGIHLNPEGGWSGVSEAQRLKWQEMFGDLSIPDQLDRASEWLRSRPDERTAYEAQPEGLYAFIVRWLLRESRAAPH
jgi:hypothetical protein